MWRKKWLREDHGVESEHRLLARLGTGGGGQHAVLQHAVVIDRDRNEHHVARAERIETRNHVAQQPEFRRAQPAVAAEAAFGKDRLRDARRRRHVHVARKHLAIERLAGIPADEIGAHRPDQAAQPPDLRPFADGVAQRRRCRRDIGHQHVVHVGAMIDDEDDRRCRDRPRQAPRRCGSRCGRDRASARCCGRCACRRGNRRRR